MKGLTAQRRLAVVSNALVQQLLGAPRKHADGVPVVARDRHQALPAW
jgi:hypothetical protein